MITRIIITSIILIGISATICVAQITDLNDKPLTYDFNLRQGVDANQGLGLDFDIRYKLFDIVNSNSSSEGNNINFNFSARGHQDFSDNIERLNSMVFETSILGRNYSGSLTVIDPYKRKRFLYLSQFEAAELSKSEENELNDITNEIFNNRTFFIYKAHYRFETSQDVSTRQHVVGAGLSIEIPFIHSAILDPILGITRPGFQDYKSQPLRLYAGLDYVAGFESDDLDENGIAHPRARIEMAWRTLVFDDLVLRTTFNSNYLLGDPEIFDIPDKRLLNFLEVSLNLPVSDKVGVIAKYSTGKQPPIYQNTTSGTLGLNFLLQ